MESISDLLDDKLRDLKSRSFSLLQQMPDREDISVYLQDGDYSLAVWKDVIADDTVRIVVQAYKHVALGVGNMIARGFVVSKSHGIRDMRQEELWEFI